MKKISLLLVLTMIVSMLGGVSLGFAADGVVDAVYGTPNLDGDASDAIWAEAPAYTVGSGEFKMVWNDNGLYVLAVVNDTNLDKSSSAIYMQDSIEVFIDELNDKTASYGDDDAHYRVNFDNERSTDSGDGNNWYSKTSIRYDEEGNAIGYIVESVCMWVATAPANGTVLGFDFQVNECSGGNRGSAPAMFDTTGNAYQNTGLFGNLKLDGKKDTDVTPPSPFALMNYIENVEARNLDVYTNGEIVDKPLADAKALLASGVYTQKQLDDAKNAIDAALKQLDDGSGKTNPEALPEIAGLPELMTFQDGTKVESAADWEARREEILDLYSYYMYGYMPDKTQETLTYTVKQNNHDADNPNSKILEIQVEVDGKTAKFDVLFTLPDPEKNPMPEGG
ncbi:MAG: hypothetical protein IJP04_09375, partial [Clostridia bacterium]|nr:hypothetical protein [Clostridia bacterium]